MQFLLLQQKTDPREGKRSAFFHYLLLSFLKGKFMIKFCLSKFLFLLSCIIIDNFYELYLTFSCFFLVCFVKNYGIKKCNVK